MTYIRSAAPAAAIAAALAAAAAAPADARQLNFAIGHPPVSFLVQGAQMAADRFAGETGGDMSIKVFPLSLLSMAETPGGLRDGLADVGTVMTPYFPNAFPHTNLVVESSMLLETLGDDIPNQGVAFTAAVTEFLFTACPECNAEFAAENQVFTGGAGTPPYVLNCTSQVTTMEELSGARLRIGGANWARWSEAVGAVPVTMSGNEMLEALNQGVLDCIILSTPDIYNFGMGGAVAHITKGAPGGAYFASVSNVNRDTWTDMTADQRRAFLKAMAYGNAWTAHRYQAAEAEVEAAAQAKGVEIHQADAGVRAATAEFIAADIDAMVADFAEAYGVSRGDEMLAAFRGMLAKWVEATAGIDDPEALGDLFWSEIYAKVDPETHGLR
ncbi:C4-dicarboxylate TRAP transporter substrate-binding protein [Rhodovulum sp. DZ06]|uniref:C4-dicarboxylate TRAP transporter substrate-binding protein n=1 Tax=Rhodovulum sp. DZ06 TaxID=3425126 RepID=UPI003D34940D